ncbi:MAG: DUF4870 domain-containing protein [Pseudomonadota bacterium]|nr:DUF4870 domain-containing protein [Pseudomonadota bacterium]
MQSNFPPVTPPTGTPDQIRQWALILHLSQYAGLLVPFANLIAPVIIWQLKKNEMPELDQHGKNVVNWNLSLLIYAAISAVLMLILVGFLFLAILGILFLIFPLIASVKANEGTVWQYPLSIRFF